MNKILLLVLPMFLFADAKSELGKLNNHHEKLQTILVPFEIEHKKIVYLNINKSLEDSINNLKLKSTIPTIYHKEKEKLKFKNEDKR